MEPLNFGVIGCGNISGIYLDNLKRSPREVKLLAVADLDPQKAIETAAKYHVFALTPDELLNTPNIDLVINLTIPSAHSEINIKAIAAGKHVYTEKPFALNRNDGVRALINAEDASTPTKQIRIGAAPDTFLGAGLQTCRQLIDEGAIGQPIGFNAFMLCHGHEDWHPNPEFYYQKGGGPLFDMGPYYLTALVSLLGPVKAVTGMSKISFQDRLIGSEPKKGKFIEVETPTHVIGLLEFESGVIGQLTTSFDVWHSGYGRMEIYGTEGTLGLPDPNTFEGPVFLRKERQEKWESIPVTRPYSGNCRGIGVMDMAFAIKAGRPHRASGRMAVHVLDIMELILESSKKGERFAVNSVTTRPLPLPLEQVEDDI